MVQNNIKRKIGLKTFWEKIKFENTSGIHYI